MGYTKAEDILPADLIQELHKYVNGACIYIPKRQKEKITWGNKSGYRKELDNRNQEIFISFQRGVSVNALSEEYFLSEKSIYRIISKVSSSTL